MYIKHKKNHKYAREKVYAVYKGQDFKCTGTWDDILRELKVSESTLRYYISPSYQKRFKKGDSKRLIVVDLEKEIEKNEHTRSNVRRNSN